MAMHDDDHMNNDIDNILATNAPAFASDWNEADTTLLQPNRLDRSKPLRAWERKPASPFARQKLRVGKVWKRSAPRSHLSGRNATARDAQAQAEARIVRRLRAGEGTQSPLKIVKRLCLGANEGLGLSWDRAGSPRKRDKGRIVTRSSRAREEEMLELEDEEEGLGREGMVEAVGNDVQEEDDAVEGTVIEFLDEEGKTLADEDAGDEDGWADVDNPALNAANNDLGSALDADALTMTKAGSPTNPRATPQASVIAQPPLPEGFVSPVKPPSRRTRIQRAEANRRQTLPHAFTPGEAVRSILSAGQEEREESTSKTEVDPDQGMDVLKQIPAGGGSSAVERYEAEEAVADREGRKQLLQQIFFANDPLHASSDDTQEGAPAEAQQYLHAATSGMTATERKSGEKILGKLVAEIRAERAEEGGNDMEEHGESLGMEFSGEEEWQDISDEESDSDYVAGHEGDNLQPRAEAILDEEMAEVEAEAEVGEVEMEDAQRLRDTQPEETQPDPSALSPRRSSRRKSSTPIKTRTFQHLADAPHILAFSPVKRPRQCPSTPPSSNDAQPVLPPREPEPTPHAAQDSPLPLERSTSAPPKEPRMSPRLKTAKPRISDDTAFIQAFLSRAEESKAERLAAESKPARRVSAHKKESLSNRRDSDTVRQALSEGGLGGKAEALVLEDLDTNSPAPRKSAISTSDWPDDALVLDDGTALPTYKPAPAADSTAAEEDANIGMAGKGRRRSIRDRRRPPSRAATTTANTIALRGDHEPVVLKRSEAQELANVTRANTRKNKGTSIMPTLRLTKIAAEKKQDVAGADVEGGAERIEEELVGSGKRGRGVRWDETLAYYQEAPVEPEEQLLELGDSGKAAKLQGSERMEENEQAGEGTVKPIPAAETPSKPKIRKLSARRTASTPGKAPSMPLLPDNAAEMDGSTQLKPKERKSGKRTRIATPGKALPAPDFTTADHSTTNSAPPPPQMDLNPQPKPKALGRKRLASRLPAPAPAISASSSHSLTASTTHTSSSLFPGPDKSGENHVLTSSPARRKAAPTASTSVSMSAAGVDSSVRRLAFGRGKIGLPAPANGTANGGLGGLMSPAKKASRAVDFGGAEVGSGQEERVRSMGLNSSPAKKRAKR